MKEVKIGDKIKLPVMTDQRGDLSFIEGGNHIPFDIARVYYLHSVPEGVSRGAHAHKDLEQVMIAVHGSFDLVLDNGEQREKIHMHQSAEGVYLNGQIWREMKNFSDDCVCLVLASKTYDENDYIRCYKEFKKRVGNHN